MKKSFFICVTILYLAACSESEQLDGNEFYEFYTVDNVTVSVSEKDFYEGDQPIIIQAQARDKNNYILPNIQPDIYVNGTLQSENTYTPLTSGIHKVEARIEKLNLSQTKTINSLYYRDVSQLDLSYDGIPYLTTNPWSTLNGFSLRGYVNALGWRNLRVDKVYDESTMEEFNPQQAINNEGIYSLIAKTSTVQSNPITINVRPKKEHPIIRIPVVFHFINTSSFVDNVDLLIHRANDLLFTTYEANSYENPNKVNIQIEFYLANSDPQGNFLVQPGVDIIRKGDRDNSLSIVWNVALNNYWNPNQYLNVYIVRGDFSSIAQGAFNPGGWANYATLLNYELPGAPVVDEEPEVPFFNSIFLNNNLKTGAFLHEFGHIMTLYHNFDHACQNDGDYLADTYAYNIDTDQHCDQFRQISSNIMDYKSLKSVFTYDQGERIRKAMEHGLFIPSPKNMKKNKSSFDSQVIPELKNRFIW